MSQSGSGSSGNRGRSEPPIPDFIDQYRILRRIGRGGQGDVYLAHDPNFDIDVAIKVLHPEYRTDDSIERLKREARLLVRLHATNIVRVFNFNANPRNPYLVMEYCDDGDLNTLIKRRQALPLGRLLAIARQIAAALAAAHEHDPPILHRDLKPGNVLFQRGVPKVADFGLAKTLDSATTGLTRTRGMMGTVGYASPEQLDDVLTVDHRTDIWALGVILYELMTFRLPFPGNSLINVAIKVRLEPPVLPSFELPRPVWEVIRRCLEKSPANRFASAGDVTAAIDQALLEIGDPEAQLFPPDAALDELDRLAARAAQLLDGGDVDAAAQAVDSMRSSSPDSPLTTYWSARLRAVRDPGTVSSGNRSMDSAEKQQADWLEHQIHTINGLLDGFDFTGARQKAGELLMRDPANTLVQRCITRISEREGELNRALDEAHEQAKQARAAGDLGRLHTIWKELDERFPHYPDIASQLAVAQRELELDELRRVRAGTERAAGKLESLGDLAGAIATWEAHLARHADDPEAAATLGRLRGAHAEQQRRERLRALGEETGRLREAGDLPGALAAWEGYLEERPDDAEATSAAEALRQEIRSGERDRARALASERAGKAGEDVAAVLDVWSSFAEAFPEDEEGQRLLAAARDAVGRHERRARAEQIARGRAELEERLRGERYRSCPEARARVAAALEEARAADGSAGTLAGLDDAARAAETLLAAAVLRRRTGLRELTEEALERLGSADGIEEDATLRAATDRAAAVLCAVYPADAAGDPLAAVAEAEQALAAALKREARERGAAIARAREHAERRLVEGRQAAEALGAAEAGPAVEQLEALAARLDTGSLSRLAEVARSALAIRIRSEAASAAARGRLARELEELRDEALGLADSAAGDDLQALAREATAALEALASGSGPAPDVLAGLGGKLRDAVAAARARREGALAGAQARWEKARQSWHESFVGGADPELARRVEGVAAEVEAATARLDVEEVDRGAAWLEALCRSAGLEAAWGRDRSTVETLEDRPDSVRLVADYRRAVASGSADGLEKLRRELEREAKRGGGKKGRARAVPAPDGRVRQFNERHHPTALARFDRAAEQLEQARGAGRKADAARLAHELEAAHEKLLQPPPAGRRALSAAAAAVVMAGALGATVWQLTRPAVSPVTLVSSGGEVRIAQVSRGGSAVGSLAPAVVGEAGVVWQLASGAWAVRTERGREVTFDVPGTSTLVLTDEHPDYRIELVKELELDEVIPSDAP